MILEICRATPVGFGKLPARPRPKDQTVEIMKRLKAETDEREYVLGTDRAELERLGLQHQLWVSQAAAAWERAGFRRGHRILDVGCGPGFATVDLAQRVGPRGKIMAVDISRRFLAHLEERAKACGLANIRTVEGSVERLPIRESGFDGAYARWVLCFVRRPRRC